MHSAPREAFAPFGLGLKVSAAVGCIAGAIAMELYGLVGLTAPFVHRRLPLPLDVVLSAALGALVLGGCGGAVGGLVGGGVLEVLNAHRVRHLHRVIASASTGMFVAVGWSLVIVRLSRHMASQSAHPDPLGVAETFGFPLCVIPCGIAAGYLRTTWHARISKHRLNSFANGRE